MFAIEKDKNFVNHPNDAFWSKNRKHCIIHVCDIKMKSDTSIYKLHL